MHNRWTTVLVTPFIDYHYSRTAINNTAPPPHASPGRLASGQQGSQFPRLEVSLVSALPYKFLTGAPGRQIRDSSEVRGPLTHKNHPLLKEPKRPYHSKRRALRHLVQSSQLGK